MLTFRASALLRAFTIIAFSLGLLLALAAPAVPQDTPPPAEPGAATATERLLEILRDDAARQALIDELEGAVAAAAPEAAATEETEEPSFGRQLALLTQETAESVAERLQRTWASFSRAGRTFSGLGGNEVTVLFDALSELLIAIVLTVGVFIALRRLFIPVFRRMGTRAASATMVQTGLIFGGSVILDVLTVILAWAIAYAVTLMLLGEFGTIDIRQTLYLNAFLIVELAKVGMRTVLAPSTAGLRPVPLSDRAARSLNRHANVVVSVIGYGQLLVVPVVNQNASFAAGRGISALLSLFVLGYLVVLVLRRRKDVAHWLTELVAPPPPPENAEAADAPEVLAPATRRRPSRATLALSNNWHWFALAYLAVMFVVVMTRPTNVVFDAVLASVKIALALVIASVVSAVFARAIAKGVSLPIDINAKLPLLERRLNSFVPRILLVIRFIIVAALLIFALDTMGLISARTWLEGQFGLQLAGTLLSVALMLLVAAGIWLAMTSWVDYRLNPEYGSVPTSRETTLLTLLRNAATIAIVIITLMFCLSELGLDIGPLLASAGVLGLAIGFGAQKMVQDIITGVFIQFENVMNVGDVVTAGTTTGVVEKLTVRSVSLRDLHGVFHVIPFSSVDMVSNFTRDFAYFVADMGVAYREDIGDAKQAMFDAFDELRQDPEQGEFIAGDLEWFGLNSFGASEVILRARIKTLPGKQWGVGRAYNGIVKRIFDERNIEIPFPHQTIYFGERKDGTTQTLHVASDAAEDKPAGA